MTDMMTTALIFLVLSGAADITLNGMVMTADGAPIAGATIVLRSAADDWRAGASGADGAFALTITDTGSWRLWVANDGYRIELVDLPSPPAGETLRIILTPDPASSFSAIDAADRALFDEGSMLLTRNRYEEALPKFVDFAANRPWLVKTHYNIGLCHLGLARRILLTGDRVGAAEEERRGQKHFEVVLGRYPDFSPALAGLAESLVRTRDIERAAAAYEKLVILAPRDAATWYNYGDVLAWQKKNDEAEKAFLTVLEVDRSFIDAHARLGAIAMAREDYDTAIERFEYFVARAPASDMAELTKELLRECREKKRERAQP